MRLTHADPSSVGTTISYPPSSSGTIQARTPEGIQDSIRTPSSVARIRPSESSSTARTLRRGSRSALTPHPRRARDRAPQELAGPRPSPRTPGAHERHRPSRRRPARTPADRRPQSEIDKLNPRTAGRAVSPPTMHELVRACLLEVRCAWCCPPHRNPVPAAAAPQRLTERVVGLDEAASRLASTGPPPPERR